MLTNILYFIFILYLIYFTFILIMIYLKNKNKNNQVIKLKEQNILKEKTFLENIDFYLNNLEDDYLYSYLKRTNKLLLKVNKHINNNDSLMAIKDLDLIKRIDDKYIIYIINSYLTLTKKQRKEQRKLVIESIKNINNKIIQIIEEINERNVYDMTKSLNLSNGMIH